MLLNIQNASPCQRLLFMCPARDTFSFYAQQCNEWTLPVVLISAMWLIQQFQKDTCFKNPLRPNSE